ncbi:hypothetical protein [Paenibacillus zanthoxyli]|uniref:hypothetical protein n=1 Tax=Paenibacillus zanthoxyli TaxID=369399 RepID=UPI00047232C7|nr:hypothetical protein [Paenibacillus zanthoxyli]
MKKLFALFCVLTIIFSISSTVFAEDSLKMPASDANNIKITTNAKGETVYTQGGKIPEGAQVQTSNFYAESDLGKLNDKLTEKESLNSLNASSEVTPKAIIYGKLTIWIDAQYHDIYSGWTATFEPGVSVSYVNLVMSLQKTSWGIWSTVDSAPFSYIGGLSNQEENTADFYNQDDGYYRTRVTGNVTTVSQGRPVDYQVSGI